MTTARGHEMSNNVDLNACGVRSKALARPPAYRQAASLFFNAVNHQIYCCPRKVNATGRLLEISNLTLHY